MFFVDEAVITVKSGNGGNGAISFRREKFVENGGPDGGDGGKGGDIIFEATNNLNTLVDFNNRKIFEARSGENGSHKNMTGASGEDLVIKVPVGTIIREFDTGLLISDFKHEERKVILIGGQGGQGNVHFRNSISQVPQIATKGRQGKELKLKLELKLLADVAIVGFPNVGKSTLINTVSHSKSKVGDYPFTTLIPKLGVVKHIDKSFVVSDIPGLIEGASEGKGLGYEFLKHIERCRIIWHLVDASEDSESFIEDFEKLNREMEKYSDKLAKKKQLIVASKCEIGVMNEEKLNEFEKHIRAQGHEFFRISSHTSLGLTILLDKTIELLDYLQKNNHELEQEEEIPFALLHENLPHEEDIIVEKIGENKYNVHGRIIKQVKNKYVFAGANSFALYLKILNKLGLEHALRGHGVKTGDMVKIFDEEFEFVE